MEVERRVTHRCTRQREHHTLTKLVTCDHQDSPHPLNADDRFCVNPRYIPVLLIPCDECYSIESFWRRIPWEPDAATQAEIALVPVPSVDKKAN